METSWQLLARHWRVLEAVSRLEREAWGSRSLLASHSLLAALYALRLAAEEGREECSGEEVFLAALLHDASKPLARSLGADEDAAAPKAAETILKTLSYPQELVASVAEILQGHHPCTAIVRDADTLAKLGVLGYADTAAKWASRGYGVIEASIVTAAKQLTAIENIGQILQTRAAKKLAESLAAKLQATVAETLKELEQLGLKLVLEKHATSCGRIVVVKPPHCPHCTGKLEETIEHVAACGGIRVGWRCTKCSWSLSYTLCPTPRSVRDAACKPADS